MNIREVSKCRWFKRDCCIVPDVRRTRCPIAWKKNCRKFPYGQSEDYVLQVFAKWANVKNELGFFHDGLLLATLRRGLLTIKQCYTSDGATLAPDFDRVIPACFVHDFICQFYRHRLAPFKRSDGDQLFRDIMRLHEFEYRHIYGAIVPFGVFLPKGPVKNIEIREI